MSALKIKKGDTVIVLSGKDKGKEGTVTRNLPREGKVVVAGVNLITRHNKPSQTNPNGGISQVEAPMAVAKVALKDPKTGQPTRVGFAVVDGKKVRVAKKSGAVING
ncbi:50S ribosomal protein L24 [Sandarakinorhabdus oryzae]|uniref:50S ribosomal protein L24 n=1 Tax=Sandarakinorhabdus oryzae TaxID=2675220 RepID=UPI0012E22E0C|nr:50S ribosomal protein L24 [Sandarakinorhabdus oryzae]